MTLNYLDPSEEYKALGEISVEKMFSDCIKIVISWVLLKIHDCPDNLK